MSFRVVDGGVGGLRPECDFCPRRLPGFGERNEVGAAGVKADSVRVGLGGGDGESLSRWNCRVDEGGGYVGDFARSAARSDLRRERGRVDTGGLAAGTLLLRAKARGCCVFSMSLLGLRSASSSMTRPSSKSSSGSGEAILTSSSLIWTCFFSSSIFLSCLLPWPDSNMAGMTSPSSSLSSSSSPSLSVSGREAEVAELEEGEASARPRFEYVSDDWDDDDV